MFSKCFKDVSRKFQENVKGVSKKFHVACPTSQLPEQKEGFLSYDPRSKTIRKIGNMSNLGPSCIELELGFGYDLMLILSFGTIP